jgi:hypothetical protein
MVPCSRVGHTQARRRTAAVSAVAGESVVRAASGGAVEQVSGTTVQRPGWGLARVVSYAFAMAVHLACVALLAVAIWLIVTRPSVVTVILAIIALFLAYHLRPRLGSLRKIRHVRYRDDAPVLFHVLDQVADEVGAKPVHAVVADGSWNASYSSVCWRRRRVGSFHCAQASARSTSPTPLAPGLPRPPAWRAHSMSS